MKAPSSLGQSHCQAPHPRSPKLTRAVDLPGLIWATASKGRFNVRAFVSSAQLSVKASWVEEDLAIGEVPAQGKEGLVFGVPAWVLTSPGHFVEMDSDCRKMSLNSFHLVAHRPLACSDLKGRTCRKGVQLSRESLRLVLRPLKVEVFHLLFPQPTAHPGATSTLRGQLIFPHLQLQPSALVWTTAELATLLGLVSGRCRASAMSGSAFGRGRSALRQQRRSCHVDLAPLFSSV